MHHEPHNTHAILKARRAGSSGGRAIALCLGIALVAGAASCGPNETPQNQGAPGAPAPVEVNLVPVVRLPVERTLTITGTLFGREEATISAKVGGRITAVLRDLGDAAPSGAALMSIDPTDYRLAVETQRAALAAALARLGLDELPAEGFDVGEVPTVGRARAVEANARARYQRARELFVQTPPLIAEQEYADIRTQAEVASWSARVESMTAGATLSEARSRAAQLAVAQQQLADTTVVSPTPTDGATVPYEVGQRLVSLGELVTSGQPLVRLVAADVIRFRGEVPERYAGRIVVGQGARISVDSGRGTAPGVVRRVSPAISERTRTFTVEVEVPNRDGVLRPGAFARAEIVVGIDPDIPHVPGAAVATFAGVQRVFGVRDGRARGHIVSTGPTRDGLIEIEGELPFDMVVRDVRAGISDGRPVTVAGSDGAGGRGAVEPE